MTAPGPRAAVPPPPAQPDEGLERWRLVLGAPAERWTGPLRPGDAARDAALEWLYGRDPELRERGVRPTAPAAGPGGDGPSQITAVDWLDDIHRLFPKETVERLERDAVEQYEIHEIVTDPDVLARVEPNPALLQAVLLRTKHLMNPKSWRWRGASSKPSSGTCWTGCGRSCAGRSPGPGPVAPAACPSPGTSTSRARSGPTSGTTSPSSAGC
ncbi:hypothetical protein ACFQZC_24810 [Streptacidiphilus monticola]